MRVRNQHIRRLQQQPEVVGGLLDTLATKGDAVWPHERWPRMLFDKPMAVGAKGGHGPIRYTVESYEPGRAVLFRFTGPKGFLGTHGYSVEGSTSFCELKHSINMKVTGTAILSWPLAFRPLHDALLEDSLDKVEARLNGVEWKQREWPLYVRVLRRMLAGRRR